MRAIISLLLVSLQCFGAGANFNAFATQYAVAGANSVVVTAVTGSGSGYGCVLFWFNRAGTLGTPMCNGHNMTPVGTPVSLAACSVISQKYVYYGPGISPGSVIFSGTQTGGTDNNLFAIVTDGSSPTQPDANAGLTSGNFVGVSGGQEAATAITTASANALVFGEYCSTVTILDTPSSNGTLIATDGNFNVWYWRSTTNPASAGPYNLQAKNGSAGAQAYVADGISIAALVAAIPIKPFMLVIP